MSDLLTAAERNLVDDIGKVWNKLNVVVGTGSSRELDLQEACFHIHALQRMIMANAAGRAYPDEFRLLGHSIGE